jgi:type I restriction enzyme R subunit
MFCVSSVEVLIKYYELFAKRKAEGKHTLKVATIFSYTANEEDKDADGILDEDGGEIVGGEGGDFLGRRRRRLGVRRGGGGGRPAHRDCD